MKGIQFLKDFQGNLKSVLVDLKEHQLFWQEVVEEIGEPVDFQFLVNQANQPIAVLLELPKHEELWEDIYDILITDDLQNELSVPWEEVKKDLKTQKIANV